MSTITWNPQWGDNSDDSSSISIGGNANPGNSSVSFGTVVVPVVSATCDYNIVTNKPQINGIELIGNKSNVELNIKSMSNFEIEALLSSYV